LFAPVRSQTAFEETLDRLGTAIKLGLLAPGTRLPAERELCEQLGIARSTLRQALTALVQSGHLHAVRGRGGGTFVAESPPPADPPSAELIASWRDICDQRLAVELGVAVLAAERATPEDVAPLDELVRQMEHCLDDFPVYRRADVRFHVALAEATHSPRLVTATTEAQGAMTDVIHHIAHPPEVLAWSNAQHARLIACLERRDSATAARIMTEHLHGTEHVLAGLLPEGA
jgi:DNA-binding FadR family transcriptional regulator